MDAGVTGGVVSSFARALDTATLWRLGMIPFEVPTGQTFPGVDPQSFWGDSNVRRPTDVQIVRELSAGAAAPERLVDLEGPSSGPGSHPGGGRLIARARLQPQESGAPLILILHGFAIPAPLYDERFVRRFAAAGAHAVRLDLPFHLRRRIPDQCSGAGYFGADLGLVRASIRQSVEDAAAIVAWARRYGASEVAILGFSLGGLVALLLAAQVEVDSVAAVVPLCDPPTTFLEHLPRRARLRIGLVDGSGGVWGADEDAARAVLDASLAPVVARHLTPVTPGERMTLVAAGMDSIVGTRPVGELARSWGTRLWEYRHHGHMSVLGARGLAARLQRRLLPQVAPLQDTALDSVLGMAEGTLQVAGIARGAASDPPSKPGVRLAG